MGLVGLHQYLDRIEELLEAQQLGVALAHCHHILRQHSLHLDTYRLMGRILLERRENEDAIDTFRRVLSVDPEDLVSHAGSAIAYKEMNQLEMAVWHMERAAEIDAYNSAVQEELSYLYQVLDLEQTSSNDLAKAAIARLHSKGGSLEQAKDELQILLAQFPERSDLQVLLAEVLFNDDRITEAANTSTKILYNLPDCIKANAILGLYYLQNGSDDIARQYARKIQPILLPERGALEEVTLAGRFFSALNGNQVPEKVTVEVLDYRIGEEADGDLSHSILSTAEHQSFSAGIPPWLKARRFDELVQGKLAAEYDSNPDDPDDVLDWLRTIAEEENIIIESDDPSITRSDSDAPHLVVSEEEISAIGGHRLGLPIWKERIPLAEDQDDDGQSFGGEAEEIDGSTAVGKDLPPWLQDVIDFTDNLRLDNPETMEKFSSEKEKLLSAALSGGIVAHYRGGPTGTRSTSRLEVAEMSGIDNYEEPRSDDQNENANDEWLDALGSETADPSAGATSDNDLVEGDLGEVEPGEEIPDWLREDIDSVQDLEDQPPDEPSMFSGDETIVSTPRDDASDADVPEWLEAEISNHQEEGPKGEDLSWLEDLAAAAEDADEPDETVTVEEPEYPEDMSALAEEIPEDPDEAVAWLEELAARQDEQIIAEGEESMMALDEESPAIDEVGVEVAGEIVLPGDDQEALEWLDEIVAVRMTAAAASRLTGTGIPIEEQVTPKAEFDVDEAMREAEKIMLEDQIILEAGDEEDLSIADDKKLLEEEQVVVDWLDELAAVEEAPDEGAESEVIPETSEVVHEDLEDTTEFADEFEWLEALEEESLDLEKSDVSEAEAVAAVVIAAEAAAEESPEAAVDEQVEELADVQIEADDFSIARESLESGDFDRALEAYGAVLESGERLPDLIADLESAVDQYGSQPRLKRLLGEAYSKNGQLQRALDMFREALDHY